MFYDEIDKKLKIRIAIISIWVIAITYALISGYTYFVQNVGFMPEQPLIFSHETHSGKFGIKCLACHFSAEFSDVSSLPTVKVCMSCHVGLMTQPDKTALLLENYDENKPISWSRVYRLPDYVRFSHSRHILAMIDCASCHGEVETMAKIFQNRELTMKWCLDCHRTPEMFVIYPRDISGIYTDTAFGTSKEYYKSVSLGSKSNYVINENNQRILSIKKLPITRNYKNGPLHCSSCHY